MGKRSWEVTFDDGLHIVELDHGFFTGRRVILLDGDPVVEEPGSWRAILDLGSDHAFEVSGRTIAVHVRPGLGFRYDLSVDGRSVESGAPVAMLDPMPAWAWLFVAACALIPVLTLGGGIPALIGAGGATACAAIARNGAFSPGTRVAMCCAAAGITWAAFLGLAVTMLAAGAASG